MKSKIVYPKAKINIGLRLIDKREDGYHNLESIFVKIPLHDIIELAVQTGDGVINFTTSGIDIPGLASDNLIIKVFEAYCKLSGLDIDVDVHLHKQIPIGAGLGGGSSDAAYFLSALNDLNDCRMNKEEMKQLLNQFGSDCSFFLEEHSQFVSGTGHEMFDVDIETAGLWLCLIYPNIHVSTAHAYANCELSGKSLGVKNVDGTTNWNALVNDFESSVFNEFPELGDIKNKLKSGGAIYTSMSGSGSTIYGLYRQKPSLVFKEDYLVKVMQL